jgi:hypothetical protein
VHVIFHQAPDASDAEQAIDVAVALGREVNSARDDVGGPDWESEIITEWQQLARQPGWSLDEGRLQLDGEWRGMQVSAMVTHDMTASTRLEVRLPRPVSGTVRLMRGPVDSMSAVVGILGLVTSATGDSAFDERFATTGASELDATHLLNDEARALLMKLPDSVFNVRVQSRCVELAAEGALDARTIEEILDIIHALNEPLRAIRPRGASVEAGYGMRQGVLVAVVVAIAIAFVLLRAL